MSVSRAFARHWLGLPAARGKVRRGEAWVKAEDGTHLATAVVRPSAGTPRSTVLLRTAADVRSPRALETLAAALLAEQGHAVVLQTCRGLHGSEGGFEPFLHEARDGGRAVDWALGEAGLPRPLTLAGTGYAGHAAWAAQAARSDEVDALIAGFAASDPHAWLYRGGALQLDTALPLALDWASGEPDGEGAPDPWRGIVYRPVREADRVAFRHLAFWRGWVDHPERGPYWDERTPTPHRPPRHALLLGGLYDAALPALLADHARLAERAEDEGRRVQLLIGPWSARALPLRQRIRSARREATVARTVVAFLDALSEPPSRSQPPVRVFVCGAGAWRDLSGWPDPVSRARVFYLSGDGRAGGVLRDAEPAEDEVADVFLTDPADVPPSGGGASGLEPGPQLYDSAGMRGDVLAWATGPLETPLRLVGPARLLLFTTSESGCGDVCARLLQQDAEGRLTALGDGIARNPAESDAAPVEVALTPLCHQLPAGARLLLEVSGARFPRFDRHPNSQTAAARAGEDDGAVARRSVFHEARRPSRLELLATPTDPGAASG